MRSNSDEVEKNNDCFAIYTSPPPTAEPLLEEKPLKALQLNLMHRNDDSILSQNKGRILFALGVYVGETIISNYGGEWDLNGCKSETSISVRIDENTVLFPVIRVMARYEYGTANSIYTYGYRVRKEENDNIKIRTK